MRCEYVQVVTSVVFFHSSHVLVGVSSDKMIKFWDVSTGKVLCSCKSDEALAPTSEINNDAAIVVPSLQTLKVAKNEETLVGAYDNGVIRVWEPISNHLGIAPYIHGVPIYNDSVRMACGNS